MNFNFQAMDADPQRHQNPNFQPQSSSSSSTFTCFTEQAIPARIPSGNFGGGHGGPEIFRGPEMFGGRLEMRGAIQWELEKERIREEIFAEEMARKRILEAEVRHELMMEREMAMRSGGVGFPSPFMPLSPPPNHLEPRIFDRQPIGLEERIIMSLEERHARGRGGHPREIRGFDVAPIRRFQDPPKFEGIPTHLPEGTKKKVIVFEKPNSKALAGAKRKPPPVVAGESSDACSDTSKKKKKITEEWSCAICEVSATNERGLTEHLNGKKHQIKEAALIAQKTGANYGLGVAPKNTIVKPLKLSITAVKVSTSEKKPKKKKPSSSTAESNDIKGEKVQKNKEKFKFWCEMCKVGAFSEKVMNNHKEGKKHLIHLVELLQKGRPEIICENEGKTGSETSKEEGEVESDSGKEAVIEEEEGDNM